jgi:hypothetical protein
MRIDEIIDELSFQGRPYTLAEMGIEELEDIVYPNEFSKAIRQAFKQLYPTAKLKLSSTEEGYVHVTAGTLNLYVGASVYDSELTISVSGGLGLVSQGEYPGAVTAMIAAVRNAIVSKYGQPTNTILSVGDDKGHGVWQHIAAKLGMGFEAHS